MSPSIISVIIPVLNEAPIIEQTLTQLTQYSQIEVIVVDGGSQDDTVAIVKRMTTAKVKVITVTGKGRAGQMNVGASIAQSELLLFLHADTQLPVNFIELVTTTCEQEQIIAGAFDLRIEGSGVSLRLIEMLVKMRSHLFSLPYGDQGIFISQQNFIKTGGFAELPIMEDFEFIQRIKRQGKIAIAKNKQNDHLPAVVTTSGRRWQKLGIWQTTLINQLMIVGYYLGISPTKLSQFYRKKRL